MTMLQPELVKCAVCGKGNEVLVMTSTSRFGPSGLDTRPPAMYPFTMFLQTCKHCGYVNYDISEGDSSIRDFLDTEMYKTCDGINPVRGAKEFIQYALIAAHSKVATTWNNEDSEFTQEDVFWGFLNAAWSCDDLSEFKPNKEDAPDEEDEEYAEYKEFVEHLDPKKCKQDAIECRKRCLSLIEALLADKPDQAHKETFLGIKADLLRRTGQFDAVITEYTGKTFENKYVDQVVRFEIDLAKAKDTKAYTMGDIDLEKYPLKTTTD